MKIGFLYEPAYWLLLEKLIHDLEREVRLVGGESFRLSSADLERACVDLIYVLPCDRIETLRQVEKRLLIINSTQSQEIAIDKIATSRLLIDNGLPTPQTIISLRCCSTDELLSVVRRSEHDGPISNLITCPEDDLICTIA